MNILYLYQIEVRAVSESGLAGPMVSVDGNTQDRKPTEPRGVAFVTATTETATFTWYAPLTK